MEIPIIPGKNKAFHKNDAKLIARELYKNGSQSAQGNLALSFLEGLFRGSYPFLKAFLGGPILF